MQVAAVEANCKHWWQVAFVMNDIDTIVLRFLFKQPFLYLLHVNIYAVWNLKKYNSCITSQWINLLEWELP